MSPEARHPIRHDVIWKMRIIKFIDDVSNSEINDFLLPTYNHKRHASQQHGGGSFIVMSVELKKTAKQFMYLHHTLKS